MGESLSPDFQAASLARSSPEMKRGRKPLEQKRKRLHVYIDEALYAQFQLLHFDRQLGKAEFGAFSEIMNLLLQQYVEKKRGTSTTIR